MNLIQITKGPVCLCCSPGVQNFTYKVFRFSKEWSSGITEDT